MAQLEIHQFPCLSDNYGVLVHDAAAGVTAAIDAPDAAAVRAALEQKRWQLTHILTTHHHHDHTGGNLELKLQTRCIIVGPAAEAAKIPGIDIKLAEGDSYQLGAHAVQVLDTPGHTAGHISYWLPSSGVAFVGDTLFALGCGRVIEGSMEQMWHSLEKLMRLPPQTQIYCGHEYTQANAKFALTIEPDNAALQHRAAQIAQLRAAGQPTLPTRLDIELETNPFLRPMSPAIRAGLDMEGKSNAEVFAEIRERKNRG